MHVIQGIPVSPGIVIGRAFALDDQKRRIPKRGIPADAVERERHRLDAALKASIDELARVRADAETHMGDEAAKIFLVHIGMLGDKALVEPMRKMIAEGRVAAEYAVYRTFADWAERFAKMPDTAFTTKVNDLEDLSARVLRHLIGEHKSRLADLDHEAVIVAQDLTPSQVAGFDRSKVVAFATDLGGRTGHTSIVARALRVPAVVGCGDVTRLAEDGMPIIVDGERGVVIIDPEQAQIAEYRAIIERRRLSQLSLDELAELPAVTRDGVPIELLGNIEFPEEIEQVLAHGGVGVGLYRTEFLYLARETQPSEEDHYAAYVECVRRLAGRTLTIRTVDLGADKYTQRQAEQPERNPALGLRSIRYCLRHLPMFHRQLRALLRASALGPIKIMFPLITGLPELRQARWVLNEVMEDLTEEGVPFDRSIEVGMMVEAPSAAIMADAFAGEVAFFSIGTNDLVQYTVAADRTNERVAMLFNPMHPAVVRLIRGVLRVARRRKVPASCCGESAGDPDYAVLLMGLGLRTLSTVASAIPRLKRVVRGVTIDDCERIAHKALTFDSDASVASYVRDQVRKIIPGAYDGDAVEERA